MVNFKRFFKKQEISVIRIDGVINHKTTSQLNEILEEVPDDLKALFVVVNSRGGSATQSCLINDCIKYFCEEREVKCYTFAEDFAASGGYMILSSGKTNPSPISNHSDRRLDWIVWCLAESVESFLLLFRVERPKKVFIFSWVCLFLLSLFPIWLSN